MQESDNSLDATEHHYPSIFQLQSQSSRQSPTFHQAPDTAEDAAGHMNSRSSTDSSSPVQAQSPAAPVSSRSDSKLLHAPKRRKIAPAQNFPENLRFQEGPSLYPTSRANLRTLLVCVIVRSNTMQLLHSLCIRMNHWMQLDYVYYQ